MKAIRQGGPGFAVKLSSFKDNGRNRATLVTAKSRRGGRWEGSTTAPRDSTAVPRMGVPVIRIGIDIEESIAFCARPDALTLYMRGVGEVALLTRAEETALARRVQAGDEQAREHMIRANLRLVVKIARGYENLGLPLLDVINEGDIGLIKAVERFDPDKGAKLSTYGAWWIKHQIRRALADQGRTIRVPINAIDQIYHLKKAAAKFQEVIGREATNVELADELDLTVRRVAELREVGFRPASLDAPLSDEHGGTLGEVVADENAVSPAQLTDENDSISRLRDLVARLPEREAQIIRSRFGLDDGLESTLETIGTKLGVTRERIRQLQHAALKKLRQMLEGARSTAAA